MQAAQGDSDACLALSRIGLLGQRVSFLTLGAPWVLYFARCTQQCASSLEEKLSLYCGSLGDSCAAVAATTASFATSKAPTDTFTIAIANSP